MDYFHKHVAGPNGACMCLIGTATPQSGTLTEKIGCARGANLKTLALVDPQTKRAPEHVSFIVTSPSGKVYDKPGLFDDGTFAQGADGKLIALKIPSAEVGEYSVTIAAEKDSKFWFQCTDFCGTDCKNSLKDTVNQLVQDPQAAAALAEILGQPELLELVRKNEVPADITELTWGWCFVCKASLFTVMMVIVVTSAEYVELMAAAAELLVSAAEGLGVTLASAAALKIVQTIVGWIVKDAAEYCCEQIGLC